MAQRFLQLPNGGTLAGGRKGGWIRSDRNLKGVLLKREGVVDKDSAESRTPDRGEKRDIS